MDNLFFGPLHRTVNSGQCTCEYCKSQLRMNDVFDYQFKGPISDMSNCDKDYAISNHGQVPKGRYSYEYAFSSKILPDKRVGVYQPPPPRQHHRRV
jgi:hypothetical protein